MKSVDIVRAKFPNAFAAQNGARFEVWSSQTLPRTLLGLSQFSSEDAWHDAVNVVRLLRDGCDRWEQKGGV